MKRENINNNWLFTEGQPAGIVIEALNSKAGEIVNLPHDFTIGTDTFPDAPAAHRTGYYGGGIGTYTKTFDIPEDFADKRILTEFDGAHMNATVVLNGHTVMKHNDGYCPFHADLTPYIMPGRHNRLSVTVNNSAQPNSRWYTGSGLYRDVDFLLAQCVHIAPWGIFASTSHIVDGIAFVKVVTTVENHTSEDADLWVDIIFEKEFDGTKAGAGRIMVHLPPGEKTEAQVTIPIENAFLWDIDSPNLYRITAYLSDGEEILDSENTAFGIRTISFDTKNGFMLNDRTVKLKGGCVHHDNGILGAASFKDSEYRRMKLHKENGYNAIRSAHNPPSKSMLDACDRLGLLVIDEAFDVWTIAKNSNDYSLFFEEHWKTDMELFMLRDRNHPCIIIWSIGNEITERGGLSDGYRWASKLAEWAREIDNTRPILSAVCSFFNGLDDYDIEKCSKEIMEQYKKGSMINWDGGYISDIWAERTEAFIAPLDVVGYNYLAHRYEEDHKRYPERIICCTESRPKDIAQYWDSVERLPYVIGDFVWTSYDYIGEAGIGKAEYLTDEEATIKKAKFSGDYPWRMANAADFDICGNPRPQLAYRKIVWGSDETFMASHNPENYDKNEVVSQWGWPECDNSWAWKGMEGRRVMVDVYSAAQEVELILNGKSMGKKPAGKKNNYIAKFDVVYEPGTIEAISYINGKKISSALLKTPGEPADIRIVAEKKEITADGQALCFAVIEIIDEAGNIVSNSEINASAEVNGAATLAAFGTGNPKSTENYAKGKFISYKGKWLAIVRAGTKPGVAILTIDAKGLGKSASVELMVK